MAIRFLIADDDPDDLFLFQEAAEEINKGIELVTAKNGEELLHWLSSTSQFPDLIFIDINMPVKNGLDSLSEIREQTVFNSIPVIVFSTSVNESYVRKSQETGANLYVQKPSSFDLLKKMILHCLNIYQHKGFRKPITGSSFVYIPSV